MKVEPSKLKRGDIIALMRHSGRRPETEVLRVLIMYATKREFEGQILFSKISGYNVGETYGTNFAGSVPSNWRIV